MAYSYRQLTAEDVPLMVELLRVFADAFNDPQTYLGAMPGRDYLQGILGQRYFIVLVAMDAYGKVVAGLAAYELQKFEQERNEIYIYDLAVAEPHRRRGIATRLINELKPIARQRGAYVIFVQADAGDVPAIKLYESLGAGADVHHFDIPLD